MAKEIERKFLVTGNAYKNKAIKEQYIMQGYLSADADATVRVRIKNDQAFITVKSRNKGATRDEWEYEIPVTDAKEMMKICKGTIIEKNRYLVPDGKFMWEIDEFHGRHEGLVLAEIELPSEDCDDFSIPEFISTEVTGDVRYYNSNLSK